MLLECSIANPHEAVMMAASILKSVHIDDVCDNLKVTKLILSFLIKIWNW